MPRYFFDLHNDLDALDHEGKEFANLEAAKAAALCEVREMIQASVAEHGKIDLRHFISLRDESGSVVLNMHFEDAVTVRRGEQILNQASAAV
jgi:hypothetical protein